MKSEEFAAAMFSLNNHLSLRYIICNSFAETLVTTSNPATENLHAGNLEYNKVKRGKVYEAEEDEEGSTEVKGKHSVPLHQFERLGMQLLTDLGRHIVGRAEFLFQYTHQALELRSRLLLLAGIGNVRFQEYLPKTVSLGGSGIIFLLLLLGIYQLASLFALQEEEVCLDVIVSNALLPAHAVEA